MPATTHQGSEDHVWSTNSPQIAHFLFQMGYELELLESKLKEIKIRFIRKFKN